MRPRISLHMLITLATFVAAIAALMLPATAGGHGASGTVLLALLAGTVLAEALPVHLPERDSLTLGVLPAALLSYYFGPYCAALAAAAAIAAVYLWRRRTAPTTTIAVAIVSVWAAYLAAHAAMTMALPLALAPRIGIAGAFVETGSFCLVFAFISPLLSAVLDDDQPHPEPISSLAMLPIALILVGLAARHGMATLPLFLLGAGAALIVIRSNINMMTLRRRVARLARHSKDMTAALRVEHDTIAAIVNYSGEGIFTVDKDLRIRHFNPALAALTGVSAEKAVGRPAEEILGARHAPTALGAALERASMRGRAVRIDSTLDADGRTCELTTSYTAIPGPTGGLALGVGVVRDVTAEREDARIREDYFSLVTHDLRNPLTASIGNTHLLGMELAHSFDQTSTATARRLVERIEKANQQLLRLVNNLRELQRIESGHELLRPQPVALRPLAEEMIAEFRGAAREGHLMLRLSGPDPRAWGDPTWCREIVANLLSNAIKYTPPGGGIDVRLEARGGQVAVSVQDTGYGLIPEEIEKLFTKFFRGKRPEIRATRGSGLGLALAKRMAERMSGDIVVSSEVGVGSIFTVLLPLGNLPPFLDEQPTADTDTDTDENEPETPEPVVNGVHAL